MTLMGVAVYPLWTSHRHLQATQRDILYHADHPAIAAGCREVWESRPAFGKVDHGHVRIDRAHPSLPPAIRRLNATVIFAFESGVHIELGGQWGHYGFDAVFDDKPDDRRNLWKETFPSKQVAPGLWLYAENGLPAAE